MDLLTRQVAELALRMATLSANGVHQDVQLLDDIEVVAARILREVSTLRAGMAREVGDTSGAWPAMQPVRRW